MGEAKRRKLLEASNHDGLRLAREMHWPLADIINQKQLEAWFADRGIDASMPGMHDTRAFLRIEEENPEVLNLVARLVEARSYGVDELRQAEGKILVAAEAVASRVARDGRQGLCVIASGILSRILDELGIWNYVAKSNLAIRFPRSVSVEPRYFYSIDTRSFAAPHAMVVAPPFTVIDVTVKHQMYQNDAMAQYLPMLVTSKDFKNYHVTAAELVAPEARAELRMYGRTVESFIAREKVAMLELMKQLPSREVRLDDGGSLGYGIVGVGGYKERLREMCEQDCKLDGLSPIEVFERDVLSRL